MTGRGAIGQERHNIVIRLYYDLLGGRIVHNIVIFILYDLLKYSMGATKYPRKQHQKHDVELMKRSGVSFYGFQELRDKTTFEEAPPEAYRDAYKITFRQYIEEWEELGQKHQFEYYQLSRRSSDRTEQIGRITTYTNEDRLRSLLYRYFNPDHASPLSFHGRVRLSGSSDDPEGDGASEELPARMPYVTIPASDVEKCNLWVDDEVAYTIVSPRGDKYSERYHLSLTSNPTDGSSQSLILPLTRIKRLVFLDDGTGRTKYIKKSEYDEHTLKIQSGEPLTIEIPHYKKGKIDTVEVVPVHRFIEEGDEVAVMITPEEWTKHSFMDRRGRYDFVINTLMLIDSKRRAEARRLEKLKQEE